MFKLTLLILFIYFILGILLAPVYQYKFNVDSISYFGIATKYAHGEYYDAINAYWSLLLPLLMAFLIRIGFAAHQAVKIITIIAGGLFIMNTAMVLELLPLRPWLRKVLLLSLVPICLFFALRFISPDLLVAVLLTRYFLMIFKNLKQKKAFRDGLKIGLIGSLLYLAKSFNFFFFIIHFLIINFYLYFNEREAEIRKYLLRRAAVTFFIFLSISSVWIVLLSNKYSQFTIGTTGSYNYAVVASPNYFSQNQIVPAHQITPPPNRTAFSSWEDPSYYDYKSQLWHPFQSLTTLRRQMNIIINNIDKLSNAYNLFSLISMWTIIELVLVLLIAPSNRKFPIFYLIFLSLLVLHPHNFAN